MIVNILVFGTENFNRTLDELKNNLQFNFIPYKSKYYSEQVSKNYHLLLIENNFLLNQTNIDITMFDSFKLPILLISDSSIDQPKNILCDKKIYLPLNFFDFKKKINNLLASYKFNKNSSVNIKNYIIDKNLKIMKKGKLFTNLTEKEINLLILLNEEKKPLNKNIILKKIWQYSIDADTHTVETHIYRLRKKVLDKFGDKEFINIFKEGYSL